jgi:hypothetical protein
MSCLKYFVIVTLFILPLSGAEAYVTKIPYKINQKMALRLLIAADAGASQVPDQISYDGITFDGPPFYSFSHADARGAFDYWSVNPWTGDVWDLWTCKKISTSASLSLQTKIRKRFTQEEMKQYDLLAAVKPQCQ